ncbi:MAG: glycosyltransferase family 4 protein [Bacillota bacterium]
MKRIVLLNHVAHPGWISGAEKSLLILANVLAGLNYQVMVISPAPGLFTEELEQAGIPTEIVRYDSCFWEMMQPGRGILERLAKKSERERDSLELLNKAISSYKPDYVVVNSVVNALGAYAVRRIGVPVAWFVREPIENGQGQKDAAFVVSQLADRVVVISRAVAQMFTSYGFGGKVVHLPNAIDTNDLHEEHWPYFRRNLRNKLGMLEAQCLVGFVGTLSYEKGADHFLAMADKLARFAPGTVFCLAGMIGNEQLLAQMELLFRKGLPVYFLGYRKNISTFLPAVDIVVLPTPVAEGGPRTALEAMAFGKPVVGYGLGGMAEMIHHGHTGYLVPPNDQAALVRAVYDLIIDSRKRVTFGQEARRRVEAHYNMESYEYQLMSIFR